MGEFAVKVQRLNHYYGRGAARRRILCDVELELQRGEIVILTGPSGSGKSTILTLIGALRSVQEGSLVVLSRELKGASQAMRAEVRKDIGFIFQAHNLIGALTARQNVEMALQLRAVPRFNIRGRARDLLRSVGLADREDYRSGQLSGGQRQRVAVARALAGRPRLVLADEPTASLDKASGREVVDLLSRLAKENGCTVLLVTHDNRILDIADRIIGLEDGVISSFTGAVVSNMRQMLAMLAHDNRRGEFSRRVAVMSAEEFTNVLDETTSEFERFLRVSQLGESAARDSMLQQLIEAFALKVAELMGAERVSLFMVDRRRGELWSKIASGSDQEPLDIRFSLSAGIAGRVAREGRAVSIPDAYLEPDFNRDVDLRTGFRTRAMLCVPLRKRDGEVFAVAQLLNKHGGGAFVAADEKRFVNFAESIGLIVEAWWRMAMHRGGSSEPGVAG
jgi:putative ABC transport system ATP-binding protein